MKKVLYAAMLLIVLHYLFVSYIAGLIYPNHTGYIMKMVDNNILVIGETEVEAGKEYQALWVTVPVLIGINHDLEVGKKVKVALSNKETSTEGGLAIGHAREEELLTAKARMVPAKGLSIIHAPKPRGSVLTEFEAIQLALLSLGDQQGEQVIQELNFDADLGKWQIQFVDLAHLSNNEEPRKILVEVDDQPK